MNSENDRTALYMFLGFFALPIIGLIVVVGPYALAALAIAGFLWATWKIAQGIGSGTSTTARYIAEWYRNSKEAKAATRERARREANKPKPPSKTDLMNAALRRHELEVQVADLHPDEDVREAKRLRAFKNLEATKEWIEGHRT